MEHTFNFNNKRYTCTFEIDSSIDPYYIFITLHDKGLIKRFGTEVTIETDFTSLLTFDNGLRALDELRQSIFDSIKSKPEIIFAKLKREAYLPQNTQTTRSV